MRAELDELNQSAVASLDEGFEQTLTLHRLGVFPLVGRSLKTTNVLESVNAQAEQRCGRVDRWRNSNHKQRWLAAALIYIEPRLRRLDSAIATSRRSVPRFQKELGIIHPDSQTHAAACSVPRSLEFQLALGLTLTHVRGTVERWPSP